MSEAIRWTITVSRETDLSLRSFLGAHGMKKGDLSKFVEKAVCWKILDQTAQEIKARNRDIPPEDLESIIDQAVRETRAEMHKSMQ